MEMVKKAYNEIDAVLQEVITAEEQSLEGMRHLLEQENLKFKSPAIKEVIRLLGKWNKVPSNEIKAEVIKLLKESA